MRGDGELPAAERRQILEQMMQEWRQQLFAGEMNAKVAKKLGDEELRQQVVARMTRAEGALAVLEEELEKVGKLAVEASE